MGCDFYADENGEFELMISWKSGERFKTRKIKLTGLAPGHKIYQELFKGKER